ncbi:unnamed protein product [Phytophthora fragariaefolia]|uniref:Unnamed protein product n=1 Tax=Phytophthora fragariaefolia TaxID=1490495 RepID=A0A9W6TKI5_9STRA|nr:unnamed protein product [Phytophthora fragariaefolia]
MMGAPLSFKNRTAGKEMNVDDVKWRSLWRELSQDGWKVRPPRGIEQDYRYIPPGGNARGEEGVDYFLGARAVIQNYLDTRAALPNTNTGDHDEEAVNAVPIAPDGEREGNSELLCQAEALPGDIRTNPRDQAINEPEPPGPDSEEDDDAARDDDRDPEFLLEPANDVEDETKAPSEQAHGQTPRRRSRLPDIAIADESDNESKDED